MKTIDPARIAALMHRERRQFIDNHPKSRAFSERAGMHFLAPKCAGNHGFSGGQAPGFELFENTFAY